MRRTAASVQRCLVTCCSWSEVPDQACTSATLVSRHVMDKDMPQDGRQVSQASV